MPRPNPPRDVLAEEYLAQRIQIERERRDMSYEGLARRMTEAGCPINQSALYKIEQGKPRRRITVDELVALARVFEVAVGDLLMDPQLVALKDVAALLREWQEIQGREDALLRESSARKRDIRKRLQALAAQSPEAAEAISRYWSWWPDAFETDDEDAKPTAEESN